LNPQRDFELERGIVKCHFLALVQLNWRGPRLAAAEREDFLDKCLSACQWTRIYYAWRPNLSDDADNHLLQLAVAGQAEFLVTRKVRDLRGGESRVPQISVITPTQFLKEQA
jgi:predicted nucleic acid-binding protein